MRTLSWFFGTFLLVMSFSVQATEFYRNSKSMIGGVNFVLNLPSNVSVKIQIDEVYAKFSTLMGEPTAYCLASWSLQEVSYYDPSKGSRKLHRSSIPASVLKQLTLYNVRFAFKAEGSRFLECDAGIVRNSDSSYQHAFNVPGSPNWSKAVIDDAIGYTLGSGYGHRVTPRNKAYLDYDISYLSAAKAKALYKRLPKKLSLDTGNIVDLTIHESVGMNIHALVSFLEEKSAGPNSPRTSSVYSTNKKQYDASKGGLDDLFNDLDRTYQAEQRQERQANYFTDVKRFSSAAKASSELDKACLKGADTGVRSNFRKQAGKVLAAYEKCLRTDFVAYKDSDSGKWGFKDGGGKVVIKPRYKYANSFVDGLAVVDIRGESNSVLINLQGKVVFRPRNYNDSISDLVDGRFACTKDSRLVRFDRSGNRKVIASGNDGWADTCQIWSDDSVVAVVRSGSKANHAAVYVDGHRLFSVNGADQFSYSKGEVTATYYLDAGGDRCRGSGWRTWRDDRYDLKGRKLETGRIKKETGIGTICLHRS